jgi:hypothetical protein
MKNPFSFIRIIQMFLTILLIVSSGSSSMCQVVKPSKDFKFKLSTPYKVIDAEEKYYFNEGNKIISIKLRGKKRFIQVFDIKAMKELTMREATDFPNDHVIEGFSKVPGKILIFYSLWDRKNKKEQLFVRELDFVSGKLAEKPVLLLSVEGKLTGDLVKTSKMGYGMKVVNKFDFETSFDSTKIAVRYRKKPETRDDSKSFDVIGLNVFNYDNGLTKLWGKEFKMPYTEKKMDELDFTVDSKGNAYILAKIYKGDKKREKDKDGFVLYSIELFKCDANNQDLAVIKVDISEKFINEIVLFESKDNNLTLTGYYNNGKKKESGVDGVFLSQLDQQGVIKNIQSYEIPLDIINQNISKKAVAKNTKKDEDDEKGVQLHSLKFRWARRFPDGSMMLTGEQYRVVEKRHVDSKGNVRVSYQYYYEDILAIKVDSEGKLSWMKRLPKTQTGGRGMGGMSFKYIDSHDSHYFLFLDNIKNLNIAADKEPVRHVDGAGGYLTAYKINDQTGDVTKVSIFDTKNVNGTEIFQFAPTRIIKVSPTDFVLEVYKKSKEDIMVKVSLAKNEPLP